MFKYCLENLVRLWLVEEAVLLLKTNMYLVICFSKNYFSDTFFSIKILFRKQILIVQLSFNIQLSNTEDALFSSPPEVRAWLNWFISISG